MSQDSVFTKIIKGELPGYKIYEDDRVIAFLDIHPMQPGHTLVVPKAEIDHIWDLPPEDYDAVMAAVRKVGRKLRSTLTSVARVGVQIEGLDVPHAHVKLIPFSTSSEFREIPDPDQQIDHNALSAMAARLQIMEDA